MRLKDIVPGVLVALALAGLVSLSAADKPAPKSDPATIGKLIEKLGSDTFEDREAASKALDEIGLPALKALEKAATSKDAEVRKRASALAERIAGRERTGALLAPKMVHLVYKNTPLKEAIADFEKKSGVGLNLIDGDGKLKDKKITLDTGKVPFWAALEKFCDAAGLDEADPSRIGPGGPFPGGPPIRPGIGGPAIGGPAIGAPAVKVRKLTPAEIKKLKEEVDKRRKEAEKKLKGAGGATGAAAPAVAVAVAVAADTPVARPAVKPAPGVAVPGVAIAPPAIAVPPLPPGGGFGGGIGGGPMMPPGFGGFQYGKINLMAARREKLPSDTTSSVRVRVAPKTVHNPFGMPFGGGKGEKLISLLLQVAPEPRLRWQQLKAINIEKAVDENGQKLAKFEPPMPVPPGGGIGGPGGVVVFPGGGVGMPGFPGMGLNTWSNDNINQNVQLLLKAGAKDSKKLKELTGSVQALFLGEPKQVIVADNVMKAKGKTFKGPGSGSITIKSAKKDADGTVRIEFEFEQPADVVPETGAGGGADTPVFGGGGIGIAPGGVVVPAPGVRIRPGVIRKPALPPVKGKAVEKKAEPKKDEPKKEEPKKGETKPAPAVGVAPVVKFKVAIAGGGVVVGKPAIAFPGGGVVIGGPAIGVPMMPFNTQGLTLHDAKGKALTNAQIQIDWAKIKGRGGFVGGFGPGSKMDYVAVYKPLKGQPAEPSKLVFTGRKNIEITVPFTLKDVELKK